MVSEPKLQDVKNRFAIVGNSVQLNRALETAIKVAPTDISVLILGESGVGKENVSKIIHHLSRRKHNGFIAINCGAIPAGTIDSELFGHEKGSFTSAHEARKGYFETVDGGTIFLDEIGELPLETQSRLLRVLESGEFLKVGSSKVQKTDVRVIAATNKSLLELAQRGKFREDLYYRLSTIIITIAALRERTEDIPMIYAKFASDVADKYRVPPLELTPDAMARLKTFSFPGNVRQLKNLVEQMSILETARTIDLATMEEYLPQEAVTGLTRVGDGQGYSSLNERDILYQFLYDIRRDVAELRSVVYELIKNNIEASASSRDEAGYAANTKLLTQFSGEHHIPVRNTERPYKQETHRAAVVHHEEDEDAYEIQDLTDQQEAASHSLQDVEKNMILKSLDRHKGRRKVAARELGISERTLYRKIKEYNLDND
ncbi:MAG: sigma-54 dependent transcriptional regulator [Bacteroidota bacterium]|nr:sigma-54 dependent transcriptional regulator [Bacteroidota bacterium]